MTPTPAAVEAGKPPVIIYSGSMSKDLAVAVEGGDLWLYARHPDGQWVSLCKLPQAHQPPTDEPPVELGGTLDCVIEHLEGEHQGKIVISLVDFNRIYDVAARYAQSPAQVNRETGEKND